VLRNRPWRRDLAAWRTLGAELPSFLDALEGVQHVVIAPHGPLHLLPLHALTMADDRPLAQRFSVSYVPSLTVLTQLLARPPLQSVDASAQVYVAGVAGREDGHPELFEHDDELIPARFSGVRCDLGPAAASRQRVLEAIPGADVIHLTCHGFFSPGLLGRTGLLFSDGTERPPRSLDALSPAVRRRYLVSVRDLLGHDVRARLVTLRACSSGQQRMRNAGDEFEGLSRALLAGGARSVLVSMWNVDQRSSRDLLARFYGYWMSESATESAAAALAQAQRDLLETGDPVMGHPYHWAPFALVGDWR
jgi:CHAT domain-containing protein